MERAGSALGEGRYDMEAALVAEVKLLMAALRCCTETIRARRLGSLLFFFATLVMIDQADKMI